MDIDELKQTHDDYKNNVNSWLLYKAAYSGTRALIQSGFVLKKHDRESETNHTRRKEKAYGYNFTKRLIGLVNSLLSQKNQSAIMENWVMMICLNCSLITVIMKAVILSGG